MPNCSINICTNCMTEREKRSIANFSLIFTYRLFEFRKFVSNRDTCYNLIPRDYPVQITRVNFSNFLKFNFFHFSIRSTGSVEFFPPKFGLSLQSTKALISYFFSIAFRRKEHPTVWLSMANFSRRWNYFYRVSSQRNLLNHIFN